MTFILVAEEISSGGIGILLDKSLQFTMVYHKEIIPGKIQTLKVNVNDHDLVLINLYGPNNDDPSFFDTLFEFLGQNEDEELIIGGDFNTVLDPLKDKFGGILGTHKKCREKIHSIIDSFELADIWRTKNPNSRKYTWHSSSNPIIFSRLDYFLVSSTFLNQIGNCKIIPGFMSDHSLVQFDIQFNPFERGKGYFKLNNSFILQSEYQELIRKGINDTVELNMQANPNTLWEIIKGTIRNESIKYAAHQKKENNKKEKQLVESINALRNNLTNGIDNEEQLAILKEKEQELETLYESEIKGYIIRSKAEYIEGGEKNTKYFANLEKKRSLAKTVHQLNKNGHTLIDQSEIMAELRVYYEKMYSEEDIDINKFNKLKDNITRTLNVEEKLGIEGHLTEYECLCALEEMKNSKSPGSDGLTTEFYKLFWNDIKLHCVKSLNFSFDHGNLTALQKQGIISLLPKKDKDLYSLNNWRPLTLLNTDYKIATKAIANRIKKFLSKIIDSSQTGFIKGRYIGENISLIQETIEKLENENVPGLLFFADF